MNNYEFGVFPNSTSSIYLKYLIFSHPSYKRIDETNYDVAVAFASLQTWVAVTKTYLSHKIIN